MAALTLILLGGVSVRPTGQVPLRIPRQKSVALLAYLAASPGRTHSRDSLAALLWPEAPENEARHSLRQSLSMLRRALPAGTLCQDADGQVGVHAEMVEVDAIAFERLVAEGTPDALARAVACYGGDFLAGLDVRAAPFEDWLRSERERLREMAVEALARLLAWQRDTGDGSAALQTALRLLAVDPLQEVVHRTVMRLQAAQGRRDAALRQYQLCVDLLQRELGVEPEAETKQLYRDILLQRDRPERAPEPVEADARPVREAPPPRADAQHDLDSWDSRTPIVGRDAELAALDRAVGEPVPGHQRLVMLLGEAGIGKTRVLAEFRARALARGARVLLGRAYESTQVVPFGPWVDALRRGGAIEEAVVRDLDPVWRRELVRLFPELLEPGREPAEAPDDAGRLFESVAQLLEHLALPHPLVILLEDAHWADAMTLRLVATLARRRRRRPLTLVASAREEDLSDARLLQSVLDELAAEGRLDRLVLAPLSRGETITLTQRLARPGSDPGTVAHLADRLWSASQGHPFTIVETMTALDQDAGVTSAGALPLPRRVSDVIARRLERLGDRARTLAAVAATIGREFEWALLRQAAGLDEDQVADGLEELVRRRILRVADERFDFTHDRIREVVVAGLLPSRRRLLHRQVAAALETLVPQERIPDWAALGAHCREAGLWEKAARYLRDAGRVASMRSAEREAAACFEAAIAALGRLPASRPVLEQTVDLHLELRNSWMVLGDLRRIGPCLAAAEAAATALGDAGRAAWVSLFAGQFRWWTGASPDARRFAEQATAIAEAFDDRSLRVTSLVYAGFAWLSAGDHHRARDSATAVLQLLRDEPVHQRHGCHAPPILMAHTRLARALAQLGDFDEGIRHGRDAIRLAESIGHRFCLMLGFWILGELYLIKGDLDEAIALLECAVAIEVERGLLPRAAVPLGHAYARAGRVAEGIALLEQQRAAMDSLGAVVHRTRLFQGLAHACLLDGRLDEAERFADQGLALARKGGERGAEAWALRLLGEITLRQAPGASEHAADCYRQALALATELGMRPLMARCHAGLARATGSDDHRARATALYRDLQMTV